MQVLVTIVLIVAIAMWVIAIYTRLVRLRSSVSQAWTRLEADRASEAIRTVYNNHVNAYNNALRDFPGNLVGAAAGFKPARRF